MYGARKASLKIVFFKHICAFFSVRGNIGAICSFDNPDPDSDTEGSTRTMRLLKLHYHQQQVSNWSLFCTIFETNKQTNKQVKSTENEFRTYFPSNQFLKRIKAGSLNLPITLKSIALRFFCSFFCLLF